MRKQLIFIRPLGRGRGATSAADHRGKFLSAPLAASTSYRGVEEGGKFTCPSSSPRGNAPDAMCTCSITACIEPGKYPRGNAADAMCTCSITACIEPGEYPNIF